MKVIVKMSLVKETKNTFRYEAPASVPGGTKAAVDCIYLQKAELAGQPAPITVTVTREG